jgi:thioesterase domain-containing protein
LQGYAKKKKLHQETQRHKIGPINFLLPAILTVSRHRKIMKNNQQTSLETHLENYLLEQIPISSSMGIRVDSATLEQIVLWAPLSNNINHKKTVFGGSLHAVTTLACWSLLHVNLAKMFQEHFQIVIASSEIEYFAPVSKDFKAECDQATSEDWERFLKMLQKKGKARISLHAKIFQDERLCVNYSGVFVAVKTKERDLDVNNSQEK